MESERTFTAFAGQRLIASGDIETTIRRVKEETDGAQDAPILFFEDRTGRQVDFDLRGTPQEAVARLSSHPLFAAAEPTPRRGPGRPSLGVVCREVSLLPRHWEWLGAQPGGASAAIRRLVDGARKKNDGPRRARAAREAAGNFMWAMAGNLPGFEEASRALYSGDYGRIEALVAGWPADIRNHLARLVESAVKLEKEAAAGGTDTNTGGA